MDSQEIPREISFYCLQAKFPAATCSQLPRFRCILLVIRMSKKQRMFKKTEKAYLAGIFLGIHVLLNSGVGTTSEAAPEVSENSYNIF